MIADSPVSYNERDQTLECRACLSVMQVHRRVLRDPSAFVEMLELAQLDHRECSQYRDVRLARNARRFRKEAKRLTLLLPAMGRA